MPRLHPFFFHVRPRTSLIQEPNHFLFLYYHTLSPLIPILISPYHAEAQRTDSLSPSRIPTAAKWKEGVLRHRENHEPILSSVPRTVLHSSLYLTHPPSILICKYARTCGNLITGRVIIRDGSSSQKGSGGKTDVTREKKKKKHTEAKTPNRTKAQ